MSTPHNRANPGDFAKTVLMPGDPLRAQFIAETFLENPRLVTDVRGMLGYTGTYQGHPVSVMGSGMGMPSIGIYSYELYSQYGVENIIRIGSAGSYTPKAKIFDVVLATGAYSESNYAVTQSGDTDDIQKPSEELNNALRASAKKQGIPLIEGTIIPPMCSTARIAAHAPPTGKFCATKKAAWRLRWRALRCSTTPRCWANMLPVS